MLFGFLASGYKQNGVASMEQVWRNEKQISADARDG